MLYASCKSCKPQSTTATHPCLLCCSAQVTLLIDVILIQLGSARFDVNGKHEMQQLYFTLCGSRIPFVD